MKYKFQFFLFIVLVFAVNLAYSQVSNANKFTFYAKLTDLKSGDKLQGVTVDIYDRDTKVESYKTDAQGKFKISIDFNSFYRLEFYKLNYSKKIVEINTNDVPITFQNFGAEYGGWTITMFKQFDGINYEILKDPIAKVYFDTEYNQFDYDREYARRMVKKMDQLQEVLIETEKQQELALRNLEEDYKDLIKDGNKEFNSKEWEAAQAYYQKALELKPEETYPKTKLLEIEESMASQLALEIKYKEIIVEADKLMALKNYNEAKVKYQEAVLVKPKIEYPREMISEVDQEIAHLAQKQKALAAAEIKKQQNFDSFFASAGNFMGNGNFDQAKLSAQKALEVFPSDVRAQNLLKEIEDNISAKLAAEAAELKAQQQAEEKKAEEEKLLAEKLNLIMAQAEELKLKGDLNLAKARYVEAKSFGKNTARIDAKINEIELKIAEKNKKDQEYQRQLNLIQVLIDKKDYEYALTKLNQLKTEYPEKLQTLEKIDFINSILNQQKQQDLAKAQREEEEKQKKEELKQKQFNAFMAAGDDLVEKGQLEQALTKYKLAERAKPADPMVARKLSGVQQKIDKKLAQVQQVNEESKAKVIEGHINIEEEPEEYTEEFLNEIAKEYPEGVTEVIFKKGNKTITKRIVVSGGIGSVYRKVKHSWGGEYFFRNNDPITKFIWDKETVL